MQSSRYKSLLTALLLPVTAAWTLALILTLLFTPPIHASGPKAPSAAVDLSVYKYTYQTPVAGMSLNFAYSIYYANNSGNAASNVVITDALPAGVTYSSQSNNGTWSVVASSTMVTWTKASLAASENGYLSLNVVLDGAVPGGTVLTNTVSIGSDDNDATPGNNTGIAAVTVISPTRDVYVNKSLYSGAPIPGRLVTYTINYGNWYYQANAAAANVIMTDTLPASAAFITATGYALTTAPVVSGSQVIFDLGTVPAYSSYQIQYSLYVSNSAQVGAPFTNTVDISTSDSEVNLLNNEAVHASTVLSPGVDLAVSKYVNYPYETSIGVPFSYQVNFSNLRPDTANSVAIVDRLPPGMTLVSAFDYSNQWNIITSTQAVTWTRATVGPNESGSYLYLTVRLDDSVQPLERLTNTISISSSTYDFTPTNNTYEAPLVATAPPNVSFSGPLFGVNENGGNAVLVATLSRPSYNYYVSANYSVHRGTAGETDFTPVSGTLYFYNGNTTAQFSVPITNDALYEDNETFVAELSSPVNGRLGTQYTTTVLIFDDDPPPTVQFSSNAFSYDEHAGLATITTTLNAPAGVTVTVAYSTANDTAVAGADYLAAAGILRFEPGATQKAFAVPLISDPNADPIKTVSLSLSAPVNAILGGQNLATLFIVDPNIDDNPVPVITALSPISVTAGGPTFTLTLTGTNFVGSSVVRWNGSARATTYVSGTQLQAVIPAASIVAFGTSTITVFNPAPGGGESAGVTLLINDKRKLYLPLILR